jgi:hypothetical protein
MKDDDYVISAESFDQMDRMLRNGTRLCLVLFFISLGFLVYLLVGN